MLYAETGRERAQRLDFCNFYAIDAYIRWSSAVVIANCESASILDGFCEAWLRMLERPETAFV